MVIGGGWRIVGGPTARDLRPYVASHGLMAGWGAFRVDAGPLRSLR